MGRIEKILDAIDPLSGILYDDLRITHDIINEKTLVFGRGLFGLSRLAILFYPENAGMNLYFILIPSPMTPCIEDWEELLNRKKTIVFSEFDVFNFLGISSSSTKNDSIADLEILAKTINENSSKILTAFDSPNIAKTYALLMSSKNQVDEQVQISANLFVFFH
ncbi:MAG: hypothetical protein M0Q92_07230 [Methanoregula sp.]|jgi:hypothetical protein|nr:hypothetical protein [Methanoregula sp.]